MSPYLARIKLLVPKPPNVPALIDILSQDEREARFFLIDWHQNRRGVRHWISRDDIECLLAIDFIRSLGGQMCDKEKCKGCICDSKENPGKPPEDK